MQRRRFALGLLAAAPRLALAQSTDVTVFAAASLTDAMGDIGRGWQAGGRGRLRFNFAASSILARQLDQGAAANLFASADTLWMDWAAARGLIADNTRRNLLGNDLVLVMPRAQLRQIRIGANLDLAISDLAGALGPDGRIAIGDPGNVPAGIYAKQALTRLGLWGIAEPRLARTDNVRSALLLVERGEAPVGIVYATDAAVAPGVGIAGVFPDSSHDPITYPFAIPKAGDTPAARALLAYLSGAEAAAIFKQRGFRTP